MKCTILFILFLSICICCRNNSTSNNSNVTTIKVHCDTLEYDSALIRLARHFKPSELNLDSSVRHDMVLNEFLTNTDTECLSKQHELSYFISVILLKQYNFHLSNYHQGYDLLMMKSGNAKYIVEYFEKIAGLKEKGLEMLNSGYILDFVNKNPTLNKDSYIKGLVSDIHDTEKKVKLIPKHFDSKNKLKDVQKELFIVLELSADGTIKCSVD